jgi:hypothetical protein
MPFSPLYSLKNELFFSFFLHLAKVQIFANVMTLEYVTGDLCATDVKVTYVAHQCYATSKRSDSLGLAKAIFTTHPYADVYRDRTEDSDLGSILFRGKFVALFAQRYPGKPRRTDDTPENRAAWFAGCLSTLCELVQDGDVIAFPEMIGCDLAGGDHKQVYLPILRNFAERLPPKCRVLLYRFEKRAYTSQCQQ